MLESTEEYPNLGKYSLICVALKICLNMRETLQA